MKFNIITGEILSAIIAIVGQDAVITQHEGLEKYSHDETEDLSYYPDIVVKPKSVQEVSS